MVETVQKEVETPLFACAPRASAVLKDNVVTGVARTVGPEGERGKGEWEWGWGRKEIRGGWRDREDGWWWGIRGDGGKENGVGIHGEGGKVGMGRSWLWRGRECSGFRGGEVVGVEGGRWWMWRGEDSECRRVKVGEGLRCGGERRREEGGEMEVGFKKGRGIERREVWRGKWHRKGEEGEGA